MWIQNDCLPVPPRRCKEDEWNEIRKMKTNDRQDDGAARRLDDGGAARRLLCEFQRKSGFCSLSLLLPLFLSLFLMPVFLGVYWFSTTSCSVFSPAWESEHEQIRKFPDA